MQVVLVHNPMAHRMLGARSRWSLSFRAVWWMGVTSAFIHQSQPVTIVHVWFDIGDKRAKERAKCFPSKPNPKVNRRVFQQGIAVHLQIRFTGE